MADDEDSLHITASTSAIPTAAGPVTQTQSRSFVSAALAKLYGVSWEILGLSLLIDTSHIRSFPSYNVVIGLWAFYCGSLKCPPHVAEEVSDGGREQRAVATTGLSEEMERVLRDASTFAFVTSASIIFDILFCSVWGGEITQGESNSAKFSLVMFIFTMFAKTSAIFYAAQVVVGGSDERGEKESHVRADESAPNTSAGKGRVSFDEESGINNTVQTPIPVGENATLGIHRRYSNFVGAIDTGGSPPSSGSARPPDERKPSPSFSPGISGLVSPGATPMVSRNV